MLWTAPKDMEKEKRLHRMWQENEHERVRISQLQAVLKCKENEMAKIERKNLSEIENHIGIVDETEQSNIDEINGIM